MLVRVISSSGFFFLAEGSIRFRIHFNVQHILSLWFSNLNQCIFIENTLVTQPFYVLHLGCSLPVSAVMTSFLALIRIHEPAELLPAALPVTKSNKVISKNFQMSFSHSLKSIVYSHPYWLP